MVFKGCLVEFEGFFDLEFFGVVDFLLGGDEVVVDVQRLKCRLCIVMSVMWLWQHSKAKMKLFAQL